MGTCQTCGCKLIDTVETPIDRSLAFTAMLELYPGYGQMDARDGEKITTAFLDAWHQSHHSDMYAYAREWIAAQNVNRTEADAQAAGVDTGQPEWWNEPAPPYSPADVALSQAALEPSYGPNADGNPYAQYTPEHRVWAVAQRHGKNAAAWVVDGNTSQVSARGLLKGIEDGDPAVLDSIHAPAGDLSEGGDYTVADLMADAQWVPHDGTALRDDLAGQYTSEVVAAFWHEVERLARNIIE